MKKNQQIVLAVHIIFWSINLWRNFFFAHVENNDFYIKWLLGDQGCLASIFYLHYFFILPYFLKKPDSKRFLLWFIFFLFSFTLLYGTWRHFEFIRYGETPAIISLEKIFQNSFIYAGVVSACWLLKQWLANEFINKELFIKKYDAQIQLMHSRLHLPMIISSLEYMGNTAKHDVEKVQESIIHLSNLLRFNLYESQLAHTKLSKETSILLDFIKLSNLITNRYQLQLNLTSGPPTLIPSQALLTFINTWKTIEEEELKGLQEINIMPAGTYILVCVPAFKALGYLAVFKEKLSLLQTPKFNIEVTSTSDELQMIIKKTTHDH